MGGYAVGSGDKRGISGRFDGQVPAEYDRVVLTRDPMTLWVIKAEYYLAGELLATIDLSYDQNDRVVEVVRT